MENNLSIYEKVRSCPQEALKTIQGGKLKGKSDINPMWRIKTLTEQFGPCGLGWKTTDEQFWTTPGADGEVIAWCSIKLWWWDAESGAWMEPVFGVGGSMMVEVQRGSLVSNDDAYKMAYTDAISVACKALGVAADVYWNQDRTKYDVPACYCEDCTQEIKPVKMKDGRVQDPQSWADYTKGSFGRQLCRDCYKKARDAAKAAEKAAEKKKAAGEE